MGAIDVEENLPAEIRQQRTHEYLNERGLSVAWSDPFGVSTVTTRNDLDALAQRSLVQRVHGGAMPVNRSRGEQSFEVVSTLTPDQKMRIARAAAELVSTGESILVDVGTTAAAFAAQLVGRPDLGELNVITNGISIAMDSKPPIRVSIVVTGHAATEAAFARRSARGSFLKTLERSTPFSLAATASTPVPGSPTSTCPRRT